MHVQTSMFCTIVVVIYSECLPYAMAMPLSHAHSQVVSMHKARQILNNITSWGMADSTPCRI